MTAAIAWSLARAVEAQFEFVHALLLVLPVMLIATAPISIAGWGVRESALVLAFSYAGLPETDGLIVSILLGGVMFAVGIIGGIIWLASPESPRISIWKPNTNRHRHNRQPVNVSSSDVPRYYIGLAQPLEANVRQPIDCSRLESKTFAAQRPGFADRTAIAPRRRPLA
jgi:hypothetical protein